jgi:hypothetical protein
MDLVRAMHVCVGSRMVYCALTELKKKMTVCS